MNDNELLAYLMELQDQTRTMAITIVAALVAEDAGDPTDKDREIATTIYDRTFEIGFAVGKVAQKLEDLP
jgi:hypothetical protein